MAPLFQHGLAGLRRVREYRGVHVDHHLVPLAGSAGIQLVMQRGLGQQRQRVRLLLRPGRRRQGGASGRQAAPSVARPLVQCFPGGVERPEQQRAHVRRQPSPQDHRAVLVLVDMQGPTRVLPGGLSGFGLVVHPPPAAHDALHVAGRARAPHREQSGFRLRRGHAGQGAHLGVGQLPASQGLGQAGQRPEGARHPDPLAGRAQVEAHAPAQPVGAGAEARVPAAAGVEVADQGE
ncbi:MAG: hypothetical protein WEG40_03240 [Candidatus Rokuibacteriota bacterium]